MPRPEGAPPPKGTACRLKRKDSILHISEITLAMQIPSAGGVAFESVYTANLFMPPHAWVIFGPWQAESQSLSEALAASAMYASHPTGILYQSMHC